MNRLLQINFVLIFLMAAYLSYGQEKPITGTVTDENGSMPWVNVIIKGTTQATTSRVEYGTQYRIP